MTHLEELANNDNSSKKQQQIKGFLKQWDHAKYPMHLAIYLDVLSFLVRMSLSKQSDEHDPVKAVHRIEKFNWTMAKLHMYIESSLDENQMEETEKLQLTHCNKFRSEFVHNEETGAYIYQGSHVKAFEVSGGTLRKVYQHTISSLSDAVMERFQNIVNCPVFKNSVQVLDCSKWPKRRTSSFW